MPEIEFEVWCEDCGAGLCRDTRVNSQNIFVKPCSACLDSKRDEGYEDGFNDGYLKATKEFEEKQSEE